MGQHNVGDAARMDIQHDLFDFAEVFSLQISDSVAL
jgi:hypothetical protein